MKTMSLTILRQFLPDDEATEVEDELYSVFKNKWQVAFHAMTVVCAHLCDRFITYVLGIRPAVVFLGQGNGSTATKTERIQIYLGQAAIGILIGLFLLWLEIEMPPGDFVDATGARVSDPNMASSSGVHWHETPLSPTVLYYLAIYEISFCAIAAVARTAWTRNEFPLLASLWGGGIGAILGLLIAISIIIPADLHLHLHLPHSVSLAALGALALLGAGIPLRNKYGNNRREKAFYRRLKGLIEGTLLGGTTGFFLTVIMILIGTSEFAPDLRPRDPGNLSGPFLCTAIAGALIGVLLGVRSSLIEVRRLEAADTLSTSEADQANIA